MSLWLLKRLVSSANIIESNKRDAFGRLLRYTRNRSDPSGPCVTCGTPQVSYLRSGLLFSSI